MMKQRLLRPPYFRKMEQYNLNGPPLLKEAGLPQPLGVNEFEREMQKNGTVIVDTRMPSAFAGSHIPGSLNIWLDGLSLYPGWVLTYDQRILLVLERKEDLETAKAYLYRLGFDTIRGYLCPGIGKWRNMGKPTERLDTLSPTLLKKRLPQVVLVDVREREEWEEGHIEGSKHIYVGHIQAQANRLPRDRIIATTCAVGSRGGLAASILRKMGFKEVYNVIGGMNAWENLGYPTSK
jgi:hydroxyacylglutathione hydrolase